MVFVSGGQKHHISDHVKEWSYEEIESVFKGKLDFKALAKELGKKPTPKPKPSKKTED